MFIVKFETFLLLPCMPRVCKYSDLYINSCTKVHVIQFYLTLDLVNHNFKFLKLQAVSAQKKTNVFMFLVSH